MKKNASGFTLIELLIAVAIVGILASIAYPSYTEYIKRGRRSIAQGELLAFVSAMERFYVQNGSDYRDGGVDGAVPNVYPNTISVDGVVMYDLAVPVITNNTYTLRATPRAGTAQAGDGYLQITNTGARAWDKAGGLITHW